MSPSKTISLRRFLVPVLILSLFVSCSASRHAGVTYVKAPSNTETGENVWYLYYQDVFDAYQGEVAAPPEKYPEAAHRAYERAKKEWDAKVEEASTSGKPKVMIAAVLALVIISLAGMAAGGGVLH